MTNRDPLKQSREAAKETVMVAYWIRVPKSPFALLAEGDFLLG